MDTVTLTRAVAGLMAPLVPALVVEDDRDMAEIMQSMLQEWGYAASIATTMQEAREALERTKPDVVVCDLSIEEWGDALGLASEIVEQRPDALLVAVSGAEDLADAALRAGFQHFLLKPASLDDLERVIREGR